MKKNHLAVLVAAAAVTFAGYNMYQVETVETMSDIMLANVEALADGESTTSRSCEGWWGSCNAYCGVCGSKIEDSDGSLKGSHSCSGISR